MSFHQHQGGPVFNRMGVVTVFSLELIPELFRGAKEASSAKEYSLFREERR